MLVIWSAIFLAAICALSSPLRWPCLALLAIGYLGALINGQITTYAIATILLLTLTLFASRSERHVAMRIGGHLLFIVLALLLGTHKLPGFHNTLVIDHIALTPDALPYTQHLNLDKALVGFAVLLSCPWVRTVLKHQCSWRQTMATLILTSTVCLSLAMTLGIVRWEPKWPPQSLLWLLDNLLLVSLTEEAFFRGYLQGGLTRWLKHVPHIDWYVLGAVALLFGLVHMAGGWRWALLATIAGIGNGFAYRHGGFKAALLTHFGLNAIQFFFFTYPMLAPVL